MPHAPDHTGKVVAQRYSLIEAVGHGGFGRVYRAADERLSVDVAVKVINPWWAQDAEWVERFAQEARTAAEVTHPGVVRVTDTGTDATVGPYTVAELVDGSSLREVINSRGKLRVDEAVEIVAQAAEALAAAHDLGIVHRDVKPSNLLIDRSGRVRVCDFGAAHLQTGATRSSASHTLVGTPAYMAPEQAQGKGVGPAADQYALGVVLFELLAGRVPFEGDTPVAVAMAHLSEAPPPLPRGIPANVASAALRMLAKDSGERYADCRELAATLRDPMRPSPCATRRRPRRRSERRCPRAPRTTPPRALSNAHAVGGPSRSAGWSPWLRRAPRRSPSPAVTTTIPRLRERPPTRATPRGPKRRARRTRHQRPRRRARRRGTSRS